MDIVKALLHKYPGKQFSIGETYESLIWHELEDEKPTLKELEEAWEDWLGQQNSIKYKSLRAAEYPPIVDQLDMIYREGIETWMTMIKNIKEKYPDKTRATTDKAIMTKTPVQEQLEVLHGKVDALSQHVTKQQLNSSDIQNIVAEIKGGMLAIKGFMMEIPNIQKQLKDMEIKLGEVNAIKKGS